MRIPCLPLSLPLLGVVLAAPPVAARERGTVLPELSGRAIGPKADPRRQAREQRRKRQRGPELRRRFEPRYHADTLPDGTIRYRAPGWFAFVSPEGDVRFAPRRASWRASQTSLSYDLTDTAMRRRGKDPYAMEKVRFLRATRAWRAGLRRRARLRWRRQYFARVPQRLRALWGRRDLPMARKRQLLFALWDECLEPGRSPLRVKAQQARWMILRFVQRHLPPGSAQAYTRAELKRFNARRRGRVPFAPYAPLRRPVIDSRR